MSNDIMLNVGDVVAVSFNGAEKRYYYLCPGAAIGDKLMRPNWTTQATVVGYGHPASRTKPGVTAQRVKTTIPRYHGTPSDWERAEESRLIINQETPTMTKTPLEAAEDCQAAAAAEIKRLKKQAKRAKKIAREHKAIREQREQRKELSIAVMEDIAADPLARPADRIDAAGRLFVMVG